MSDISFTQPDSAVYTSAISFPLQIQQAYEEVSTVAVPIAYTSIQNVVVCGMGGSRVPAIILSYLFRDSLRVPVEICDGYVLPGFVNEHTLVVLSSYSGTTEEVLFVAEQAHQRGAKIFGYCVAGGPLRTWLIERGYPSYTFDARHNPSKQPRMGSGYAIGVLLALYEKLHIFIKKPIYTFQPLQDAHQQRLEQAAKDIAKLMYGKVTQFVVSEHLTGIGNSLQNQCNESAKCLTSFRVIPELNHHLMEGLANPESHKKNSLFIFFASQLYSPRIQKRYPITIDVVNQNNIETYVYDTKGVTIWEQMVEVYVLGSLMSMYLAMLYQVDPMIVPYVDFFKRQLGK